MLKYRKNQGRFSWEESWQSGTRRTHWIVSVRYESVLWEQEADTTALCMTGTLTKRVCQCRLWSGAAIMEHVSALPRVFSCVQLGLRLVVCKLSYNTSKIKHESSIKRHRRLHLHWSGQSWQRVTVTRNGRRFREESHVLLLSVKMTQNSYWNKSSW